ncbi:MAG: DNA-3-methyladenine glycosylase family protein [Nitrososphaerota archaeon]
MSDITDDVDSGTNAISLSARAPFDLALTVAVLRRRRANLVDTFAAGEYRRLLRLGGRERLIAVRQTGPETIAVAALDGALTLAERDALAPLLDRMLGLTRDLTPVVEAFACYEPLARLLTQLEGMKPPRFPDLWSTLVGVVPYQQVSLEAGQAISNRMIADIGPRSAHQDAIYYDFPTPEQFLRSSDEQARAWGLSVAKVRTLRNGAEAILSGSIREDDLIGLDDDAAIARLTQLHGIGRWSAQVILLRGLGRLSAFPLGDSGAQRAFRAIFGWDASEVDARRTELLAALSHWRGYLYFVLLGTRLIESGNVERPEGEEA